MGNNNSSEIRIRPLGEHLLTHNDDIDKLLHLVGCTRVHFGKFNKDDVHFSGDGLKEKYPGFSGKEIGLAPSIKHLEGIINLFSEDDNARAYAFKHINGNSKINVRRTEWFTNCNKEEACGALEAGESWPVFEGKTRPDLFIEGERYIVVIEGKLTEPETTTQTTYLESRNQMIRHIQGALNYVALKKEKDSTYPDKKIIAFYIVPDGFRELSEIKDKDHFKKVIAKEAVPITDSKETDDIRKCYYGCTTWEKVEKQLGLRFRAIIEK